MSKRSMNAAERRHDLRKHAKGKPCMIRIIGVCNHDPATTVLAHYRLAGYCGTGQKPIDLLGAWACNECHAAVDSRTASHESREYLRLCHAEGVLRTLAELAREGIIGTE